MRPLVDLRLPPGSQFQNITHWTLTSFLLAFVNLIMVVSVIAFVFQVFIGGFKFILAGGEKEATQNATRGIKNAFIGLFIVFGTYALMRFLENFLGIPLLYFTILPVR
jgi:hypothetical protein